MELTDTATPDAIEVGEQLEAAYRSGPDASQAALISLFADELELHHVPALRSDGVVDGARMREVTAGEATAIRTLLPDLAYDDVQVEVDGDRVHTVTSIRGTLPDGRSVRLGSDMRCTVRDGRIVAMEHHMTEEMMAAWVEVATAAGMRVPEEDRAAPEG